MVKVPRFKVPDGQLGEREAYWFDTVDFERVGSMKFQTPPGVTYEKLVTNARNELRSEHPEAYKLFLLCLCAGLRRSGNPRANGRYQEQLPARDAHPHRRRRRADRP